MTPISFSRDPGLFRKLVFHPFFPADFYTKKRPTHTSTIYPSFAQIILIRIRIRLNSIAWHYLSVGIDFSWLYMVYFYLNSVKTFFRLRFFAHFCLTLVRTRGCTRMKLVSYESNDLNVMVSNWNKIKLKVLIASI